MADPAHLETAKKGAQAIGAWCRSHTVERIDLSEADLTWADLFAADLSGADLTRANLIGVNLTGADLTGANLTAANLFAANLTGADLSRAKLTGANLIVADLRAANLSKADLTGAQLTVANLTRADLPWANLTRVNLFRADLTGANLTWANLSSAQCAATVFGDCDLSRCRGLETVAHGGPSIIGIDTLLRTARGGGGAFSPAVQEFLPGAGVSRELLDMVQELVREVRYYSAFVAYGGTDKGFAERLCEDLKARGISCWLFDADALAGRSVWGEIGKGRREAEKVIVTCSAASLVRDGLLKEIEETADENPTKLVPISLDSLWREEGFTVRRGARDLKTCLTDRIYADFLGWQRDRKAYQKGLEKVLKGLRREEAAEGG